MKKYLENLWEAQPNKDSLEDVYSIVKSSFKIFDDFKDSIEITDVAGVVEFWNEFAGVKGCRNTLRKLGCGETTLDVCETLINLFPTEDGTKELLDFWKALIKEDSKFSREVLSTLIASDLSIKGLNYLNHQEDFEAFQLSAMQAYQNLSGDKNLDFYNLASEKILEQYIKLSPKIDKYNVINALSKEIELLNENDIITGNFSVKIKRFLEKFGDDIKKEVKNDSSLISKERWIISLLLLYIDHSAEFLNDIINIEPKFLSNKLLIPQTKHENHLISVNKTILTSLLLKEFSKEDKMSLSDKDLIISSLNSPLSSDEIEKLSKYHIATGGINAIYKNINFWEKLYIVQLSALSKEKDKKKLNVFFNDYLTNEFNVSNLFGIESENKEELRIVKGNIFHSSCIQMLNFANYMKDELSEDAKHSLEEIKKTISDFVWKNDSVYHFNLMLACLSEDNIPYIQNIILNSSEEEFIKLIESSDIMIKFIKIKNCNDIDWSSYACNGISDTVKLNQLKNCEEVFGYRKNLLYLLISNPDVEKKFINYKIGFIKNALRNNEEAFVSLLENPREGFIEIVNKNKKIKSIIPLLSAECTAKCMMVLISDNINAVLPNEILASENNSNAFKI